MRYGSRPVDAWHPLHDRHSVLCAKITFHSIARGNLGLPDQTAQRSNDRLPEARVLRPMVRLWPHLA
jgi:hypothetical protein